MTGLIYDKSNGPASQVFQGVNDPPAPLSRLISLRTAASRGGPDRHAAKHAGPALCRRPLRIPLMGFVDAMIPILLFGGIKNFLVYVT